MNLVSFVEKVQRLPQDKQAEVFDFVDYLADRFTTSSTPASPSPTWTEEEFSQSALSQALRGMEDEPDLYAQSDLKERWKSRRRGRSRSRHFRAPIWATPS